YCGPRPTAVNTGFRVTVPKAKSELFEAGGNRNHQTGENYRARRILKTRNAQPEVCVNFLVEVCKLQPVIDVHFHACWHMSSTALSRCIPVIMPAAVRSKSLRRSTP